MPKSQYAEELLFQVEAHSVHRITNDGDNSEPEKLCGTSLIRLCDDDVTKPREFVLLAMELDELAKKWLKLRKLWPKRRRQASQKTLLTALRHAHNSLRTFRNVPKSEQDWSPLDDEAMSLIEQTGCLDEKPSLPSRITHHASRFISEPQVINYRTVYGGRKRTVRAADKYNAACQRALKDTGKRWRFISTSNLHAFTIGHRNQRRTITVL